MQLSDEKLLNCVITIQLYASPLGSFDDSFQSWKAHLEPWYTFYELDNYSDALSQLYGQQLVEQANQIYVVLDATQHQEMGKIIGFINQLMKHRKKCTSILIGTQPLLFKVLKKIGGQGFYTFDSHPAACQWMKEIQLPKNDSQ
ncbi:MAG: hypothetical protein ACPGJS_18060 [Flammeovirgaceae bacterium]